MSKLFYLIFFSPFILLVIYAASSANQDAPENVRAASPPAVPAVASFWQDQSRNRASGLGTSSMAGARGGRGGGGSHYGQLIQTLKDAENDEQKDKVISEIRGELEKQYESFLNSNEQQIADLQERIDRLKDQLDRRRNAKNRMVDLEVERIVSESEGLVWPRASAHFRRSGMAR